MNNRITIVMPNGELYEAHSEFEGILTFALLLADKKVDADKYAVVEKVALKAEYVDYILLADYVVKNWDAVQDKHWSNILDNYMEGL
jgi:hypothetical protein